MSDTRPDGQYTLDADPMVLAKRVETLEHVCDGLCAVLMGALRDFRVAFSELDHALCEDRPLHAARLAEQCERIDELKDHVHALAVLMGRSY